MTRVYLLLQDRTHACHTTPYGVALLVFRVYFNPKSSLRRSAAGLSKSLKTGSMVLVGLMLTMLELAMRLEA